jgi:uncharacterized protein
MNSAPTTLITGASSGIGLELARIFAAAKYRLILTSRNVDALQRLAQECRRASGLDAVVIPADLSHPDGPQKILDEIRMQSLPVDVLVNNAGFGTHGKFWEIPTEKELGLVQVNITALVQLTHALLPGMVARRNGRILNVASTAAYQPGPLMANYYASKSYVLSFSQALSNELRGSGVTVTALCPGPTLTNFQSTAGLAMSRLFKMTGMSAQQVAQAGYNALMRRKRVCIPGFNNRLLALGSKLLPTSFVLPITRKLNDSR